LCYLRWIVVFSTDDDDGFGDDGGGGVDVDNPPSIYILRVGNMGERLYIMTLLL
jgi:hypothetical protein